MPIPDRSAADHLPLLDLRYMLKAYAADPASCVALRTFAVATANVFADERLARVDLRVRLKEKGDDFHVAFGDLTDDGFRFGCTGYQRWMANLGRWKGEHTLAKVEASLLKQLAASRRKAAQDD